MFILESQKIAKRTSIKNIDHMNTGKYEMEPDTNMSKFLVDIKNNVLYLYNYNDKKLLSHFTKISENKYKSHGSTGNELIIDFENKNFELWYFGFGLPITNIYSGNIVGEIPQDNMPEIIPNNCRFSEICPHRDPNCIWHRNSDGKVISITPIKST